MSTVGIEVSGLRKTYGSTLALDGMSFAVPPGRVTGFIGPNGEGKSTTMRVVLGLHAPGLTPNPWHRGTHRQTAR